jgi:hypothetical protein
MKRFWGKVSLGTQSRSMNPISPSLANVKKSWYTSRVKSKIAEISVKKKFSDLGSNRFQKGMALDIKSELIDSVTTFTGIRVLQQHLFYPEFINFVTVKPCKTHLVLYDFQTHFMQNGGACLRRHLNDACPLL